MPNIMAMIQARCSSTRLPGKILLPLGQKTVLEQVVDRVKQSKMIDDAVVLTSTEQSDDPIEALCCQEKIEYYRGDLHDVLSRYYHAAIEFKADYIIRITSDCPMYDASILDDMLAQFQGQDYMSNTIDRRFPRGLDTEIFTFHTLKTMWEQAKDADEREHVTLYAKRHPDCFERLSYRQAIDQSHHRWTLDTKEDYAFVKTIYDQLGSGFSTKQLITFLEQHPEIQALNAHIEQKKVV